MNLPSGRPIQWAEPSASDGVRIGWLEGTLVVQWPGIGELLVSPSGQEEFVPAPGASPELLEKFRATGLVALRRYMAGSISLHGAAVQVAAGGLALVGESGSGKSSTAMALVEFCGASFLADDIVPVDWDREGGAQLRPVDDSLWLLGDVRARFGDDRVGDGKLACAPRTRAVSAIPLVAIVELAFDRSITQFMLERLRGQEAFLALSRSHVCFRAGAPGEDFRNLESRARLSAVSVFRLLRPPSLDLLNDIAYSLVRLADGVAALPERS